MRASGTIDELGVLYEIVEMLGTLEFKKILKRIVMISGELCEADSSLLYLLDEKEKHLVLQASMNPHPRQIGKISLAMGEGITGWVARHQEPVVLDQQASKDERFAYFAKLPEDSYESFLSVPILHGSKTVGVINVQHQKRYAHSNDQVRLMVTIGKLVGQALQRARLLEETHVLKEALEVQKLMNRAKGMLITQLALSEKEAHGRLQKLCMSSGKSMREVCEAVLLAEGLVLK